MEKRGRSSGRSPSRASERPQGDLAKVTFKFTSSRFVASSLFLTFVGFSLGTVGYFLLSDVEVKIYTSEMDSN